MPVIEHEVHDKVKSTGKEPYLCKNKNIQPYYYVSTRDYMYGLTYRMIHTLVHHRMSKECRYDKSLSDARCDDCIHRGSGEDYAEMVRSNGA